MATPWPTGLRPLLVDGKVRTQPAAFRMDHPRRGLGYAVKIGTDTPVFWEVRLRFTQAEAVTFWTWFRDTIHYGEDEFTLPIKTEFGTVNTDVRFLPETLLPVREIGEVWEYTATIMARSMPEADPLFSKVYLLLRGTAAITKDHSSFNRTMTALGGMVLNTGDTLFGNPTYHGASHASGATLQVDSDTWAAGFGAQEWCVEGFYKPKQDTNFSSMWRLGPFDCSRSESSKRISISTVINGTSYSVGSANNSVLIDTFVYYAYVRENVGPTFASLRLYLGPVGGTATQVDSRADVPVAGTLSSSSGFKEAMGTNNAWDQGRFGPFRFTIGDARRRGGTSFPVPTGPFPAA
jgi:hypothetical protein